MKYIFKTILLLLIIFPVAAQNMNSPYSVFGIGVMDYGTYNRASGMGNTSLASYSTPYNLINKNPASITGLTRSTYVFDLGFNGIAMTYKGAPISNDNRTSRDLIIKRLSLSVKLNNHWASGVGFAPVSTVNYLFAATKNIEGSTDTYNATYEGNGGLNKVYWNNAWSVGKHLSVGITPSFIFGSVGITETLFGGSLTSDITSTGRNYYNGIGVDYGMIYGTSLNKKWDLRIGGKFSNKTKLNTERSFSVLNGTTSVVTDQVVSTGTFHLPLSYGAGIELTKNKKTTISADYSYENWNALNLNGVNFSYKDSHHFSLGTQFSKTTRLYNREYEKNFFQMGVFYNTSYLNVKQTPINDYGFTTGFGGLMNAKLGYTLALQVGSRGTVANGLVKENYMQATVTLSYRDILFTKTPKYY
jgi:hypothetical protein